MKPTDKEVHDLWAKKVNPDSDEYNPALAEVIHSEHGDRIDSHIMLKQQQLIIDYFNS